jgi:hypothetical protein
MDDRFSAGRGTYRVIYRIDDKAHVVTVVDVAHRRDVYRTWQGVARVLPNSPLVLPIKAAPAAGSAFGGPPAARRAALRTHADRDGSNHTDHAPGEAVVPGFRSSSRAGAVPMAASCPPLPSATPGH